MKRNIIKGFWRKILKSMKFYMKIMFHCYALTFTQKRGCEDVLQDAFINIFEHMKQYNGKGTLAGWMTTVVINQALMLYRKNLQHLQYQAGDYEEYKDSIKDTSIIQNDFLTHQLLLELIQSLPDGYRIVFNMHEIEGYSYDEIADFLNCTPSTCRSQLFRAKKILQEKINYYNKHNEEYNRI